MKRYLFLILILITIFTGCGKKEIESVYYSELTAKDLELIDYINNNSDCYFKLLDEMGKNNPSEEVLAYIKLGHEESEPETNNVTSMGDYVKAEDKYFVTSIVIKKPSNYHILGIHYGDTYKDAKDILKKEGFKCTFSAVYPNYAYLVYSKGIVTVLLNVDKEDRNPEKLIDTDTISEVQVNIAMEDESGVQLYQFVE